MPKFLLKLTPNCIVLFCIESNFTYFPLIRNCEVYCYCPREWERCVLIMMNYDTLWLCIKVPLRGGAELRADVGWAQVVPVHHST